jgi:alanine racemase
MPVRPTEAVVDLGAIADNYRAAAAWAGRPAIAVVKADAYGHGASPVARALERAGAPYLAVALIEEAISLRAAEVTAPILVLGGAYEGGWEALVDHGLVPVIWEQGHLERLGAAARQRGTRARAHLKIDTGMGRIGLRPDDPGALQAFIDAARSVPEVALEGICTHFANADLIDRALTERQVALFNASAERLVAAGLPLKLRHLANSAGTIDYPAARQDLCRPGLLLYGHTPFGGAGPATPPLRAAMTWKTAIVQLKQVPPGTAISYGGRWVARRPSRIATLPVGYADGYLRRLSGTPGAGGAEVLVRGMRAPIAGSICMDLCMADVTDVPGATEGDEVVLMGTQGGERVDVEELARRSGTISYEILCAISARVPRRHLPDGDRR